MKRSPMPARRTPLPRPARPVTRTTRLGASPRSTPPGGQPLPRKTPPVPDTAARRRQHREAHFSPEVRALIRARAGNACEACLTCLGERGGQIQHIQARGAGGSRNPLLGSPVGGALLCGTPHSGCHGLCETRDPGMYVAGFWIWSWETLGTKPILVGCRSDDRPAFYQWLLRDGTYGDQPAGQRVHGNPASKNPARREAAA